MMDSENEIKNQVAPEAVAKDRIGSFYGGIIALEIEHAEKRREEYKRAAKFAISQGWAKLPARKTGPLA